MSYFSYYVFRSEHAYEQPNLHLILRDCDQVFEAIINTGRWGMTV